jgi:CRISPR/Cas system CSM-associated protein Csm2 small subunit
MTSSTTCPQCGKRKKPEHPLCWDCFQKSRGSKGQGYSGNRGNDSIPGQILFEDSFYRDGFLKREIYIESAQEAASFFERQKPSLSSSSIRSLFYKLKAVEQRLQNPVDKPPLPEVQQAYYEFVRQCVYQDKRNVIPTAFRLFAEKHLDVATKSEEEFQGFVQYLTSIIASMKSK